MAKVQKNIVISGLSGSLGDQLVIQEGRGGQTIIRTMPGPRTGEISEAQAAQQQKFQDAVAYAHDAQGLAIYKEKAAGTPKTAFNVAVADFLHPPEVLEIDLSEYHGAAGQPLRARVRDDVQVTAVAFLIATEDGTLVEHGAGVAESGGWWRYQATAAAPNGTAKVLVVAEDLPGHEVQKEAQAG